jgi:inorganic pyrophosphatase
LLIPWQEKYIAMKLPETYNSEDNLNAIIETPYKSRNKFRYDPETGLFKLSKVLPAGLAFPCDMGFIPGTRGEDGDPLDILIFMDELTYPGCLVESRLFGVLTAIQKEKGKKIRNDRFLAVPACCPEYDHLKKPNDLNPDKLQSIIRFFENYNKQEGKEFKLMDIEGPKEAHKLIKKFSAR